MGCISPVYVIDRLNQVKYNKWEVYAYESAYVKKPVWAQIKLEYYSAQGEPVSTDTPVKTMYFNINETEMY